MKLNKIIKSLFFIALFVLPFVSCNYLDREEDEAMTFEKIWERRGTIVQAHANVWAYSIIEDHIGDNHLFVGASDESDVAYNNAHHRVNSGAWSPADIPSNSYALFYRGIREATIFMRHVRTAPAPDISEHERIQLYASARFARAWYYFQLVRLWGPVTILGDEVLDFNLSVADLQRQRNSMDECVAFIVSELRAAAELLPYDQPTHYFGRPTKGAAQAIISELLLYYARPLFNGNARYANLRNPDGSHIFPGIATMDPTRWRDAAAAAKAIIDMNHYSLYAPTGNPYQDFNRIFLDNWNEETIWGRFFGGNHLRIRITPRGIGSNAWGAVAPTQQLVDAFSMKNGRYPVIRRNEDGSPVIDPLAEYSETGFTNMVHPLDRGQNNVAPAARSTFNMYVNREPRFYTTILWSDARWPYNIWLAPNGTDGVVSFAFNGNSGPGPSHNHSRTGYMFRKFTNHTVNTAGGSWGNLVWPIFRYANTLLNYIEALNEYNPSHPDILIYWNQLRVRAGVPPIQEVFPERMGNQAEVRDLIRRERQVELAFEHKRFFDTRTWMIAEQTDNGPMWGMNNHPSAAVTSGPNTTPPEFWQRHSFSTRVFAPRHYLHPFPQGELDRNKLITQNYGW